MKPANAFYVRRPSGEYEPTSATVGPWDPESQHGGPLAALVGRALEQLGKRADVRLTHFSLDFLGRLPLAPLTVETEFLRPGKRIELASATVTIEGRPAVRASGWRVAVGADRSPSIGLDEAPPALPKTAATELFEGVPDFGYGHATEWRFASGGFREPGPATVWSRMRIPLLAGEQPSPLIRALTMVDAANGVSWEVDFTKHLFVPVNLTVALTREPVGEWVGMHAATTLAGDGIGTTRAQLFDPQGRIGEALQSLFVAKR